jgi:hypothetical protein
LLSTLVAPADKAALGLDERSIVLLFNTEGATDLASYRLFVGVSADRVRSGRGAGDI